MTEIDQVYVWQDPFSGMVLGKVSNFTCLTIPSCRSWIDEHFGQTPTPKLPGMTEIDQVYVSLLCKICGAEKWSRPLISLGRLHFTRAIM